MDPFAPPPPPLTNPQAPLDISGKRPSDLWGKVTPISEGGTGLYSNVDYNDPANQQRPEYLAFKQWQAEQERLHPGAARDPSDIGSDERGMRGGPAGAAGAVPGAGTGGGSGGSGTLPITAGQKLAAQNAAKAAMQRIGVVEYREPTDDELVNFASNEMTSDMIADFYSNLPEFVAKQPGLPYGMTKQEYDQSVKDYGSAFRATFGEEAPAAPGATATKTGRDQNLLGFALTNRISSSQFGRTAETFRQERGRAPTASEFQERLNRQSTSQSAGGGGGGGGGAERGGGGGQSRPAVAAR